MRNSKENIQPAKDLKQELARLRLQNTALREDVQLSFENYQLLQRLTNKPPATYQAQVEHLETQLAELQENLREITAEKEEIRQTQAMIQTDSYQELYEALFKKSQKIIRYFEDQLHRKELELQQLKTQDYKQLQRLAIPAAVQRLDLLIAKTAADSPRFHQIAAALSTVRETLHKVCL